MSPACQSGGPSSCTVDCATKILPLIDVPCTPLINMIVAGDEADDGVDDGQANIFDKGYEVCQHISVIGVVEYL